MDWLEIAGAVFLIWLVLVFLFTPGINYHLSRRTSVHADDFLYTLQSTCQAALHHGNRLGPVGGRIVGEVLVGIVDGDPESFRSVDPGWSPTLPGRRAGAFGLADILAPA